MTTRNDNNKRGGIQKQQQTNRNAQEAQVRASFMFNLCLLGERRKTDKLMCTVLPDDIASNFISGL